MPCVCYYLEEDDLYEIVDGYHRYLVMKQSQRIYDREKGMLPVTVIEKDISNRMASTIRHNRARGMHNLELMTEIVTELVKSGMLISGSCVILEWIKMSYFGSSRFRD